MLLILIKGGGVWDTGYLQDIHLPIRVFCVWCVSSH